MTVTRRDLVSLLPAALLLSAALPELTQAQASQSSPSPLPSAVYPFASLPVNESPNVITRHILKGRLATGESIEVHETTLPPGGAPHPPHHHVHSEMWLIREGTVELTINGARYQLGPGSVGFVHSNEEHGITNVGATPATYFVVAVGPGAAS